MDDPYDSPRRVRIRKIKGRSQSAFSPGTEREGWEKGEPRIGSCYEIYLNSGRIFRTATVKRISEGGFLTINSVYKLEVLED
jgi:hypothetical protein